MKMLVQMMKKVFSVILVIRLLTKKTAVLFWQMMIPYFIAKDSKHRLKGQIEQNTLDLLTVTFAFSNLPQHSNCRDMY